MGGGLNWPLWLILKTSSDADLPGTNVNTWNAGRAGGRGRLVFHMDRPPDGLQHPVLVRKDALEDSRLRPARRTFLNNAFFFFFLRLSKSAVVVVGRTRLQPLHLSAHLYSEHFPQCLYNNIRCTSVYSFVSHHELLFLIPSTQRVIQLLRHRGKDIWTAASRTYLKKQGSDLKMSYNYFPFWQWMICVCIWRFCRKEERCPKCASHVWPQTKLL